MYMYIYTYIYIYIYTYINITIVCDTLPNGNVGESSLRYRGLPYGVTLLRLIRMFFPPKALLVGGFNPSEKY